MHTKAWDFGAHLSYTRTSQAWHLLGAELPPDIAVPLTALHSSPALIPAHCSTLHALLPFHFRSPHVFQSISA